MFSHHPSEDTLKIPLSSIFLACIVVKCLNKYNLDNYYLHKLPYAFNVEPKQPLPMSTDRGGLWKAWI